VVDEAGLRRLPTLIAMYRAGLARLVDDLPGTVRHAHGVLEVASEDDFLARGAAASLLGLAYWSNGDLVAADRWYAQGMANLEQAGHHADLIAGAVTLADIRIAQGRLGDALDIYERGLRRATESGSTVLRGASDMHVGIAQLRREGNDLEGARQHLVTAKDLGDHAGFGQNPYRWRVAMAQLEQAEGSFASALGLLDEAERVHNTDFSPDVRPVPAVRARVLLAQGRIGEAQRWASERHLAVDDELTYLLEYEHVTLARILLADAKATGGSAHEVRQLLQRLLAAARQGQRTGSVIEILVLQAVAESALANPSIAAMALDEALTLAGSEGYVRLFLDEGPPMIAMLRRAAEQGRARDHARRLLGYGRSEAIMGAVQNGLVEPLSKRELQVLRLLRSDLDGPDIARELVVSLNTVRTHTRSIYTKLGVNSRRAAIRRADELGL